jgi:hypothetical protein
MRSRVRDPGGRPYHEPTVSSKDELTVATPLNGQTLRSQYSHGNIRAKSLLMDFLKRTASTKGPIMTTYTNPTPATFSSVSRS